jgi:hypothetical protein
MLVGCADEQIDRWAVLDLLGHLVDKSLVIAGGDELPALPAARKHARLALSNSRPLARRLAAPPSCRGASRFSCRTTINADQRSPTRFVSAGTDNLRAAPLSGIYVAIERSRADRDMAPSGWCMTSATRESSGR